MLEVFTWNILKTVVWLDAFVLTFLWNLLKLFIEKKIASELPIETRREVNAKSTIFLVWKFDRLPRCSFEGATCPCRHFIGLST